MKQDGTPRLRFQLAALTLSRLLLTSALRMTYPFLPALARGLGVTLEAVAQLLALRAFAGFLIPLFSPLSEHLGRRVVLVFTMVLFGFGCFIVVIWPAYWALGLTLVITGMAKVVYDPTMQSYLGDVVAYGQRGKAIAVTEFSWAAALLVGAPAIGFLIDRHSWQAPFLWLGLFGVSSAALLWKLLPPARTQRTRAASLAAMVDVTREYPVIWAAAMYVLLAMAANELLFIIYGDWMERSFDLSLTSLGLASGVIGGAEIIGEFTAGWSVDRFGKRPVIITTGLITSLMYILIPYSSVSQAAALLSLFALFLAFEITVVGSIPLLTEVVPSARSVVLSAAVAAGSLGRMFGAQVGPFVWQRVGLSGITLLAAMIMLIALFVLARWVHESAPGRRTALSEP